MLPRVLNFDANWPTQQRPRFFYIWVHYCQWNYTQIEGATPEIGFFAFWRNWKISARRCWNFFLIHKIGGSPPKKIKVAPFFCALCVFRGFQSLLPSHFTSGHLSAYTIPILSNKKTHTHIHIYTHTYTYIYLGLGLCRLTNGRR